MAYDTFGEFTWIVLYGGLGYLFGSQWELVSDVINNFGGLILGIVILGLGAWLGLRRRKSIESEKANEKIPET
jgi:LPXTG-motif cell wall-anchored protein